MKNDQIHYFSSLEFYYVLFWYSSVLDWESVLYVLGKFVIHGSLTSGKFLSRDIWEVDTEE